MGSHGLVMGCHEMPRFAGEMTLRCQVTPWERMTAGGIVVGTHDYAMASRGYVMVIHGYVIANSMATLMPHGVPWVAMGSLWDAVRCHGSPWK